MRKICGVKKIWAKSSQFTKGGNHNITVCVTLWENLIWCCVSKIITTAVNQLNFWNTIVVIIPFHVEYKTKGYRLGPNMVNYL